MPWTKTTKWVQAAASYACFDTEMHAKSLGERHQQVHSAMVLGVMLVVSGISDSYICTVRLNIEQKSSLSKFLKDETLLQFRLDCAVQGYLEGGVFFDDECSVV